MPDRDSSDADHRSASSEPVAEGSAISLRARSLRSWLILGGVIAIPLVLFVIGSVTQRGDIARGTTVAGVSIGGLSADEAVARLDDQLAPRLDDELMFTADDTEVPVVPAKAGVTVDSRATVEAAETAGGDPLAVIRGLFGNAAEVEPVLTVNDAAMTKATAVVAKKTNRKVREGAITFKGTSLTRVEPLAGRVADQDQVAELVVAHAVADQRDLDTPVTVTAPTVTKEAVDAAVTSFAESAVAGPVTVVVTGAGTDDASVVVPVARFTPFLSTTATDGQLALVVDGEGLRKRLSSSLGGIETEAKNATFRVVGGTPRVVPSTDGRSVPADELAAAFAVAASSSDDREATVALATAKPELTTAQARSLGVVEKLSSFTQRFPYAAYRYQNIGQAAERVDGSLLLPDETFSLNDTALERTEANGYTEGYVIQGGRLVEDLGGGVSTIATAIWDAAFFAGLERVEQRAHSFFISRYKPGLEATVAWGNLDLRFKNNTGHGVFITAERGRNYVTVTMYGTKSVDVDAEFGPRTNAKPFTSVDDTTDDCTPQSGVNGFTIVVTRVVTKDNGDVTREPLKTVYRPANKITCRPAATPKPSAAPTTAPPTSAPAATPAPTR